MGFLYTFVIDERTELVHVLLITLKFISKQTLCLAMWKADILNRIISYYNLKNKTGLANFLGVSPQTISNWYSRNSVDYDLIFEKCAGLDLNWLITGITPANYQASGNKVNVACDLGASYDAASSFTRAVPVISTGNYEVSESNGSVDFPEREVISVPDNMLGYGGEYVAFKLEDNSMRPAYVGGSYAVCKRAVDLKPENVLLNEVYLFALSSGKLVFRRVQQVQKSSKKLILSADNITGAEQPVMEVNASDVLAAWNAKFSFAVPESSAEKMSSRIEALEKSIGEIMKKLEELK